LRKPETSFNNALALLPFGKQAVFMLDVNDHGPAVSPMPNVSQNAASLVPINRDVFWSTAGG